MLAQTRPIKDIYHYMNDMGYCDSFAKSCPFAIADAIMTRLSYCMLTCIVHQHGIIRQNTLE